jgi:hypothetical protein
MISSHSLSNKRIVSGVNSVRNQISEPSVEIVYRQYVLISHNMSIMCCRFSSVISHGSLEIVSSIADLTCSTRSQVKLLFNVVSEMSKIF